MNKKIYLVMMTIMILIIIVIILPHSKNEVDFIEKHNEGGVVETTEKISKIESDIVETNAKSSRLLNAISIIEDYDNYGDCGLSLDMFLDQYDLINKKGMLNDKQRGKISATISNCEQWFVRLQNLDSDALNKLKIEFAKKKELIVQFISFKYDKDTVVDSRKGVNSSDYDIKYMALVYLLRFDFAFANEIAQEMNIESISYLINTDNIHLETLYICQHGKNCTADGSMMQAFCDVDDTACGLSYPAWLRSGVMTLNLYDDMMRATIAIHKVLNSDWFIEHTLKNS